MAFQNWYDKNYKKILVLPAIIVLISILYIGFFYYQNNDIMNKDVSLTGGTSITFSSDLNAAQVQQELSDKFSSISVKTISDGTGTQKSLILIVPGENSSEVRSILENYLGYELTNENSSVEFTGSSLGADFYQQLIRAVVLAFLLMALVVFLVFGENKKVKVYTMIITIILTRITFPSSRFLNILVLFSGIVLFFYSLYISKTKKYYIYTLITFATFLIIYIFPIYILIIPLAIFLFIVYTKISIPSMAVIFSAFADIIIPLAIVDFIGMKISSAGIIAFLMLIGYSVDTDILLTTRVLKRQGDSVNKAIWDAFKTGTTMTITSIIAVAVALVLVYNFGSILNQIFTILLLGLVFDLFNTWVTNASIIKWYVEKEKK